MKPVSFLLFLAAGWIGQGELKAQALEAPVVASSSAMVRGVELEYFEFGDSGITLVWIQDHHDMFRASTFGPQVAEQWVSFLRRFSDSFRVIAPVRRGWGASSDPGYGFDVATQAEDVLGLLDAKRIDRAVFVGRTFATQDVMWIAEHHPERALGVVFLGTPFIRGTDKFVAPSPAVALWETMHSRASCDVGVGAEVDRRLAPRNAYRPHFFSDRDMRIGVPALVYLHPVQDREGRNLRRLDWVESGELGGDQECDPEARAYFAELRSDTSLRDELRAAFVNEAVVLSEVHDAIRAVFEGRLTMAWGDGEMGVEPWYEPMRTFLEGLVR